MYDEKNVFAQILEFVPWRRLQTIVKKYRGDFHSINLKTHQLFRVLVFAQLAQKRSLRATVACLTAMNHKLYHMGIPSVSLNGLANAMQQRDWKIFAEFGQILMAEVTQLYAKTPSRLGLDAKVFALDSTTIDLCLSVFPWAEFRSTKAAVKVHTLLDTDAEIPEFILISTGKTHDVNFLDKITFVKNAFYVMDLAYLDFARLYKINEAGAFFIVRAKKNTKLRRLYSRTVDKTTGVRCNQIVRPTGISTGKKYPKKLRRVKFYDAEKRRRFVFLTNNFSLPAETIAALYKRRWEIELFFKWMKQNLRVLTFFGRTENAVKTQLWVAISMYLLIAKLRHILQINAPMSEMLQIFSTIPFENIPIFTLFNPVPTNSPPTDGDKQLVLPGFLLGQ